MTEAIFGLIGVVVGGLITGGLQWLDRLTQKRDRRRVAMRLVSAELLDNLAVLRGAARRKTWWSGPQLSNDAITRYKTELAALLSDDHWERLEDAEARVVSMIADRDFNELSRSDERPYSRRSMDADMAAYVSSTAESLAGALRDLGMHVSEAISAEDFEALIDGEGGGEPGPADVGVRT